MRSPVPGIFVIENEIDIVVGAVGAIGAVEKPRRPTRELDGPRERLRTVGAAALSDAELLSLLLRTGSTGADVQQVACALLTRLVALRRW